MTIKETEILGRMIEVSIEQPDDFLVIKETLTRMGVAPSKDRVLVQSCHILHKRGKYYITHFKLLFELDGRESNISDEDIRRMNTIASLLQSWKLLKVVEPKKVSGFLPMSKIKIIPASQKDQWALVSKHRIGDSKKT